MVIISMFILIALMALALYCCYLFVVGVFYLVAFIITFIQLRTGKLTREQLAENAAKYEEHKRQEKEQKRLRKWLRDATTPSVMDVVLGRSSRRNNIFIDININETKNKSS